MDVVNHYFGVFFLIYQSSGVWGNLISSLVFQQSTTKDVFGNESYSHCGTKNCPDFTASSNNANISTSVSSVSDNLRYTLMGIYTDQIDISEEQKNEGDGKISVWKSLLATFNQLRDIRQCLLIPLTMFSGFQQGFLSSDYTKAYVTCTLGIRFVGYVMICFGATNSICSMVFGKLSQYTGRIALFMLAALTSASCIIALLLWCPHPSQFAVFFIFPALWSMSDAICQTLLSAFYGVLFDDNKEAAFSNYRVWESLGFLTAFAYSNFLCVYVKLYIVLAIMILGMSLYLVVELLEYKKSLSRLENTATKAAKQVHLRVSSITSQSIELKL
ncbi:unc-93 homolog A [Pelobates cultripes]|uniref:Protein unc-93 homolog A n=1 Tax=Pelobates cultripes TaxID=61616 RepID=A0AAD1REW0_PELCU|nr:unc-93 homolog A [Pelobates cultripes]